MTSMRRLLYGSAVTGWNCGHSARDQAQQAVAGGNSQRRNENRAEHPMEPPQGHDFILRGGPVTGAAATTVRH